MVRHVILWKLKEGYTPEEQKKIKQEAKEALENDEFIDFDEAGIAADLAHGKDDEEEDADVIPCEENVSEDEFN